MIIATFPDRSDAVSGRRALVRSVAAQQKAAIGVWALVSLVRREGFLGRRVVDLTLLTGRDARELREGLALYTRDGVTDLWVEQVSPRISKRDVLDED